MALDFSLMFWGDLDQGTDPNSKYRLLLEVARYADANDYAALWIPERHFHTWGGHYPSPVTICAALAMSTTRVRLRAGSVVLPLHHPIRVAEEWSVVDNLSQGRVELSVASGWKDDDFVLAPAAYATRREALWEMTNTVCSLWRGEPYVGKNGKGEETHVRIFPRPLQPELPVWVTSMGSLRTIADAGAGGFRLLTHLLGQTFADVEKKVKQYRAYRIRSGVTEPGHAALMLHTFIGTDLDEVKHAVKPALMKYLEHSADLAVPMDKRAEWSKMTSDVKREMTEMAFERYFAGSSLLGTPESCRAVVEQAAKIGITDICCLVDFGLEREQVLESLERLTALKDEMRSA